MRSNSRAPASHGVAGIEKLRNERTSPDVTDRWIVSLVVLVLFGGLPVATIRAQDPSDADTLPAWWPATVNTWVDLGDYSDSDVGDVMDQLPRSTFGNSEATLYDKWTGARYNPADGFLYIGASGGHSGRANNMVARWGPFNTDAKPTWREVIARSAADDIVANARYYDDGLPSARHTRDAQALVYGIPGFADRMYISGDDTWAGKTGPGNGSNTVDAFFIPTSGDTSSGWSPQGTYTDRTSFTGGAQRGDAWQYDPAHQLILRVPHGGSSGIVTYDPVEDTWSRSRVTADAGISMGAEPTSAIAPAKNVMAVAKFPSGGGRGPELWLVNTMPGRYANSIDLTGFVSWMDHGDVAYNPDYGMHGAFLLWNENGQRVDAIRIPQQYIDSGTLDARDWSSETIPMSGATPGYVPGSTSSGKFFYADPGIMMLITEDVSGGPGPFSSFAVRIAEVRNALSEADAQRSTAPAVP